MNRQARFVAGSSARVALVPAGQQADLMAAGDFLLCSRHGIVSSAIRLGQRIRYWRRRKTTIGHMSVCDWTHAALVVSPDGDLVEALSHGVARSHISEYRDVPYVLVRPDTSAANREEICGFADWAVGRRYGWLTILSLIVATAPGWHVTFGIPGECICSGLVARARERAGDIFADPADVTPADLAFLFDVPGRLKCLGQ